MIFWLAELQSATDLALTESLLTPEEALVFARLSGDLRRNEWLLGRSLAKQLVQRYFEVTSDTSPDRKSIAILPDSAGAPVVLLDDVPLPLSLSISHSRGAGFCALTATAGLRIGADIEQIAGRDAQFLMDFFATGEREWLASLGAEDHALGATAVWSAKEAYYKAQRTGLPLHGAWVEIVPAAVPSDGWSPFAIESEQSGKWEGSWRVWGEYVLAVVTG